MQSTQTISCSSLQTLWSMCIKTRSSLSVLSSFLSLMCRWISNCVGVRNQKYFTLFLLYVILDETIALLLTGYYIHYYRPVFNVSFFHSYHSRNIFMLFLLILYSLHFVVILLYSLCYHVFIWNSLSLKIVYYHRLSFVFKEFSRWFL